MYTINIALRCPDEHTEVLPDTPEQVESVIEEYIAMALVELFGTVLVDDICVEYISPQGKHGEEGTPDRDK